MVSCEPVASSVCIRTRAAGTAMLIRINTGSRVHIISMRVLCRKLVSATEPLDFRNRTIEKIMKPNTTMAMPTHHQNISMCRP